ncbi:hypothetical protein EF808_02415 [archaeon]|nr:MAG: hypothetical protein EF808_02415 [archaeon]
MVVGACVVVGGWVVVGACVVVGDWVVVGACVVVGGWVVVPLSSPSEDMHPTEREDMMTIAINILINLRICTSQ